MSEYHLGEGEVLAFSVYLLENGKHCGIGPAPFKIFQLGLIIEFSGITQPFLASLSVNSFPLMSVARNPIYNDSCPEQELSFDEKSET